LRTKNTEEIFSILLSNSERIIQRLFTPAPLIKLGSAMNLSANFREHFRDASLLYSVGKFMEALQAFESLRAEVGNTQIAPQNILDWNAAACAIMLGDNDRVVELLSSTGKLYGIPLWNLGTAFYRLGRKREALKAMNDWVARESDNKFRNAKCELIIACLASLVQDEDGAMTHLKKAAQLSASFVVTQLGLDQEDLAAVISPTQCRFVKTTVSFR
jgi:tetratricopeptide (TPR) repeat protein